MTTKECQPPTHPLTEDEKMFRLVKMTNPGIKRASGKHVPQILLPEVYVKACTKTVALLLNIPCLYLVHQICGLAEVIRDIL